MCWLLGVLLVGVVVGEEVGVNTSKGRILGYREGRLYHQQVRILGEFGASYFKLQSVTQCPTVIQCTVY